MVLKRNSTNLINIWQMFNVAIDDLAVKPYIPHSNSRLKLKGLISSYIINLKTDHWFLITFFKFSVTNMQLMVWSKLPVQRVFSSFSMGPSGRLQGLFLWLWANFAFMMSSKQSCLKLHTSRTIWLHILPAVLEPWVYILNYV